jgi:hypothetical protein
VRLKKYRSHTEVRRCKIIRHFAECHVMPAANLDCGGKRSATPLFRTRLHNQMSPVFQKRRRRPMIGTSHALPAHCHNDFISLAMA